MYMSINIPTAYRVKVVLKYGELSSTVDWCNRNCSGDWRFMDDVDSYKFFFESEKDYVAFLVWRK